MCANWVDIPNFGGGVFDEDSNILSVFVLLM